MSPSSYMPHGWCFSWDPWVFWPLVAGSLGTALAYATIPALLTWVGRRRPDLVPSRFAAPFAVFIASCGLGHLLDVIVLWWPLYDVQAWWTCVTAASSLATAAVVWRARRQILGLVSAADMERVVARAAAAEQRATASAARAEELERRLNATRGGTAP